MNIFRYFMILAIGVSISCYADNALVFSFENGDDQGWHVVSGNIKKAVSKKHAYKVAAGDYIISTLYDSGKGNDNMTGVVESPVIKLAGSKISFLQGGGKGELVYFAMYTLDGKQVAVSRGINSVNISRVEWNKPELVGQNVYFRLVDNARGGWGHAMIDDLRLTGFVDLKATGQRKRQAEVEKAQAALDKEVNEDALQKAIVDLGTRFPRRYDAEALSKEFNTFKSKIKNLGQTLKNEPDFINKVLAFKRKVLLSNPLLVDQPLLVEIRDQFWGSHCPHGTMFQNGEDIILGGTGGIRMFTESGSSFKVLNFNKDGEISSVKSILDVPKGVVRDADVHFGGGKLVFSMRRNKADDYNIYEMDVDGNNLRQLTYGSELADVDPIYMPDGKIVFSSTRQPSYCQCNVHIQPNLFEMDADGANMMQISRNNLADFHGSLMPDGRILYSRWEYIDRHFGPSLGLWTTNPDGTSHQLFMGNNHWTPGAMIDGRSVPGTNLVVCIYGSCHDRPWGALTLVDRSKGMEGPEPVVKMWPADGIKRLLPSDRKYSRDTKYRGHIDSFVSLPVKYEDPWPLHDMEAGTGGGTYFLVSKTIGSYYSPYGGKNGQCKMGIFLVDVFGNEVLVYSEEGMRNNCFSPMPIGRRKRPPVIPSRVDLKKTEGLFYVMDVYQGTGDEMVKVPRGSAKWLRVMEGPPKTFWREGFDRNVDARQASPMNWNLTNNKRILGDVPVEPDGSVYFYAPADKFLHFLLLDKNKMMIQAMRTGTMIRPGEVQGCIGCHENRLSPPANLPKKTMAMKRAPSRIQPWFGYKSIEETPAFNFYTEVQPVFDKHCVSCHDYGKDAGKKLNLSRDIGLVFNTSYLDMMRKSRVRYDGPREVLVSLANDGPPGVLPAYAWGSHKSTLVKTLIEGHEDVKLTDEEFQRIVSWIDANGVYYGEYSSVYNGRIPLDGAELKRLLKLGSIKNLQWTEMREGSLVSFERPELSRILKKVGDKGTAKYNEALEIIRKGAARLKNQPREDQLGGKTKAVYNADRIRVERIKKQLTEDERSRKAILEGKKYYQYKPSQ